MIQNPKYVFWFVTGSQHLYGEETIQEVQSHSDEMTSGLNDDASIAYPIICKPVLTTPEAIRQLYLGLDAYVLPGENVDCRFVRAAQAAAAFSHAV